MSFCIRLPNFMTSCRFFNLLLSSSLVTAPVWDGGNLFACQMRQLFPSTAKIKLFPVTILEFYFRFRIWPNFVIGVLFCIGLPGFVKIELPSAELRRQRHIHFSRWCRSDILALIWIILGHPRSAIVGLSLLLKFGLFIVLNVLRCL